MFFCVCLFFFDLILTAYVHLLEGQTAGVVGDAGADQVFVEVPHVVREPLCEPRVDLSSLRALQSHGPDARQRGSSDLGRKRHL